MPIRNDTRLSPEMQTRLNSLFETCGANGTARRLGTSPSVVDRLLYGGTATPKMVQLVEAALAALAEEKTA